MHQKTVITSILKSIIIVFTLFFCQEILGQGRVLYVNANATDLTNANGSISLPYKNIQTAIDNASNTDTVVISRGIYKEVIDLKGKTSLLTSNYFYSRDTLDISATIISGENNGNTNLISNSIGNSSYPIKIYGLTLQDVRLQVIVLSGNQFPMILSNCIIKNSGTYGQWGVIGVAQYGEVDSCLFINNRGRYIVGVGGGSTYSSIVQNSIFWGNSSSADGSLYEEHSVIHIEGANRSRIINNLLFKNNTTAIDFGGNGSDSMIVVNNTAVSNSGYGIRFQTWGGTYLGYVVNNISKYNKQRDISGNNAIAGPGVYLKNNFFGSDGYLTSTGLNSINNTLLDTLGNIGGDPFFVDTLNNNYKLKPTSSAIGKGISNSYMLTSDLAGIQRPNPSGSIPDIGAYESPFKHSSPVVSSVEGGDKSVKVTWTQNPAARLKNYKIYRSTSPIPDDATTGILTDTVKVTSTNYVDNSSLTNLTRYYYRMKTVDSSGVESGMSNEISVIPNAQSPKPSNFRFVSNPRNIRLNWTRVGTLKYEVFQGTNRNNLQLLASNVSDSTYLDTMLQKNTTYYYAIRAIDSVGVKGLMSDTLTAATQRFWYVSPSGNDTNIGDNTSPLKTVTRAVRNALATDTVIMKPGVYGERILISHTKRPITIGSEYILNFDTSLISQTVLDGSSLTAASLIYDSTTTFGVTNSTYNSLIGLTVRSAKGAVMEGGAGWNLKRIKLFQNNSNTTLLSNISRLNVDSSWFINNGNSNTSTGLIYFRDSSSVTNSIFQGNRIEGGIVSDGYFPNETSYKINISGNYFEGNNYRYDWGSGVFTQPLNVSRYYFYNNIFVRNKGLALYINSNPTDSKLYFYNNTIANNDIVNGSWGALLISSRMQSETNVYNNIIQGNNFNGQNTSQISINNEGSGSSIGSLRLFNNYIGTDSVSASIRNSDFIDIAINANNFNKPVSFIDSARSDYRLRVSSVGLGEGFALSDYPKASNDYLGNPRPNPSGSNPDIGAYESPYKHSSSELVTAEGGNNRVTITWTQNPGSRLKNYKIFRSTSPIPDDATTGILTDTVKVTSTNYVDNSSLTNLTRYYYRMKTVDSSGVESGMSNEISVIPNAQSPKPSNFRFVSNPRNIRLNWTRVGTLKYEVFQGTNRNNLQLLASNVSDSTYLDTMLQKNTTYYYAIRAIDSVGVKGLMSDTLTAITQRFWYVSPNGNDANGGSESLPFKSIDFAVSKMIESDTLILLSGSYTAKPSISKNITLASKFIINRDTTFISNTIFEGQGLNGTLFNLNTNLSGQKSIGLVGISIQNFEGVILSDNNIEAKLDYVRIYNSGTNGCNPLFTIGRNSIIQNSLFERNKTHINFSNPILVSIINNIFRFNAQVCDALIYANNGKYNISNNLFIQNKSNVIRLNYSDSVIVSNNTYFSFNNSNYWFFYFENYNTNKAILTNNILYTDSKEFLFSNASFSNNYTISNNLLSNYISSYNGLFIHNYDTLRYGVNKKIDFSPFVSIDSNQYNFSLKNSSIAIGSGSEFGSLQFDILNKQRPYPVLSKPDLGAYESSFKHPSPELLTAEGGNNRVRLKWTQNPASGLKNYKIYRSTSPIAEDATGGVITEEIPVTSTSYMDSIGLTNLTRYYYRMKTVDSSGVESGMSNEISATPNAQSPKPSNFRFVSNPRNVRLNWTRVGSLKYEVFQGTNRNNLQLLASNVSDSTYLDTMLQKNTTYYYAIRAIDSVGVKGSMSDTLTAVTQRFWYVSPSGNDTNIGDNTSPLKTVTRAVRNALATDTVIMKPGVYGERILISHTKRPITIGSEYILNFDTSLISQTVLDGSSLTAASLILDSTVNFGATNSAYNALHGLTVRGSKGAVMEGGQRWNVKRIRFTQNNSNSTLFSNVSRLNIDSSWFINNGNSNTSTGLIYFRDSSSVTNSIFQGNRIEGGIVSEGYFPNDTTYRINISNNLIESNNARNDWDSRVFIQPLNATRYYFYNNVFVRNKGLALYINPNPIESKLYFYNNTIANNDVVNNTWGALLISSRMQSETNVYNNIIQGNSYNGQITSQVAISNDGSSSSIGSLKLFNNYIGTDSLSASIRNSEFLDIAINSKNTNKPVAFIDTASRDYRLKASSIGLGEGYSLNDYPKASNDYLGNPRPNPSGSNPDIGAYESPYKHSSPELIIVEGGDRSVKVTWTQNPAARLKNYKIYRSTSPIPDDATSGMLTDTVKATYTSYVDNSSLTNLTRYYYRMKTVDSSGVESGMSNELSVKPNIPPVAINDLTAEGGPVSIKLKWSRSLTVGSKYNIYRSVDTVKENSTLLKKDLESIEYVDTSVNRSIAKYFYWVKVLDSVGAASDFSNRVAMSIIPNLYVSLSGNDNALGSVLSPIRNIQTAVSKVTFGDTIFVFPGTYGESINFGSKIFALVSIKGADSTILTSYNGDNTIRVGGIYNLNDTLSERRVIRGFTLTNQGNAMYTDGGTKLKIQNCIFKNSGGGIHNNAVTTFENCLFVNNNWALCMQGRDTTSYRGGEIFINCTFTRNNLINTCGISGNWKPKFINCIIYNNGMQSRNGGYSQTWLGAGYEVFNSIIDDSLYSKLVSNINSNPRFIDTVLGDYRLKSISPALGIGVRSLLLGNNLIKTPNTDIVGAIRPNPVNSKPDAGCYENELESAKPELGLIQRSNDTTLISWDYFDKSKIASIQLYRDTTSILDTTKSVKKQFTYSNNLSLIRDTLPASSTLKYYYAIKLVLKDTTITSLSNIQAANGIVKTNSFLPPMINARYAWGDIDTDGDLDLAVMGETPGIFLQVYRNDSIKFVEVFNRLTAPQVYKGTLKFADVDNDGDIDLFASGQRSTSATNLGAFLFINDGKGVFTSKSMNSIVPTREGDATFGDHDNDGDLDLALSGIDATGKSSLRLYNNNGVGNFVIDSRFFGNTQTNVSYGDVGWVDYDNDGDLDLIYSAGKLPSNIGPGMNQLGGIIRNSLIIDSTITQGGSNNIYVQDLNLKESNFDLADINKDGKVDMVISGIGTNSNSGTEVDYRITKIIWNLNISNNNNWYGSYNSIVLDSVAGKVKFADIDNDGDMDILFAGTDQLAIPKTTFYFNSGDGYNFSKQTYEIIPNLDRSGFSWADYDNDKDLDLVISGQKSFSQGGNVISEIYSFETTKKNQPPSKPKNIALNDFGDGRVLIKWDQATDDLNSAGTLNYLVKIGTVSLAGKPGRPFTVVESNKNGGTLLNPEAVLVYSNRYFTQLDPGRYYILVQSVDNNKLTSVFTDTLFVTLSYPWKIVNQGGIIDATVTGNTNYTAKWSDIDRDNDYDFIYGNEIYESNRQSYRASSYQFSDRFNFSSMIKPNVKWHDLNQDGYPDLIYSSTEDITPLNANDIKFKLSIMLNDTSITNTDPLTGQISRGRLNRANLGTEDSVPLGKTRFRISDINNDGKPDVFYAGLDKNSESRVFVFSTVLPTDTSNSIQFKFSRLKTNLDSILLSQKSANLLFDFGDVDGDVDNDFVAIYEDEGGNPIAKVFLNNGLDSITGKILFTESSKYVFEPLSLATLDLIDFDKDGDLDLITSGRSFSTGKQFAIYESKDSSYIKLQNLIAPFENGRITFGDINNDGYSDLIYSGTREGSGYISKVALFDPIARRFNEQLQFSFGDYQNLNVDFGDFDADNDLDILLYGRERTTSKDLFRVYKNVQNESAAVLRAIAQSGQKSGGSSTEMIISSKMNHITVTEISGQANGGSSSSSAAFIENLPPTTPLNLKETNLRKVQNRYRVEFTWDASSDDNTPKSGLTYELRVGTKSGSSDVVVSTSKEDGYKLIPEEGNAGRNLKWIVDLPSGKYYWSVQAVDASLSGSSFALERQFSINSTGGICNLESPIITNVTGKTQICEGDSIVLKSSISGNLKWYNGDNLISNATDSLLKVNTTGTYKVIKNIEGCSSGFSNSVSISVNSIPKTSPINLSGTACQGNIVSLFVPITADTIVTWYKDNQILPGIKGATYTTTISGSYSYMSRSSNGCYSTISTPVGIQFAPLPNSNVALSNKVICEGAQVTLSAVNDTSYRYQWIKDGIEVPGAVSSKYITSVGGVYELRVTQNSCNSMSKRDTLIVNGVPRTPILSASLKTECEGTNIKITSNDTTKLMWYRDTVLVSSVNSSDFIATTSGSYTARAVLNSCMSGVSNSIQLVYKQTPTAKVNLSSTSICSGQSAVLTATEGTGYTYQWIRNGADITGATKSSYSAAESGSYRVRVNLDGCIALSNSDSVAVTPIPTKPIITQNNTELVSSSASGNLWYLNGVLIPGVSTQNYKPTSTGLYTVKVVKNTCESPVSEAYYFIVTSIVNFDNDQYIKIYPNPIESNGLLKIERRLNNASTGLLVRVYDVLGRLLLEKRLSSVEEQIQLPGITGNYMVELSWGKTNKKVFKIYKK